MLLPSILKFEFFYYQRNRTNRPTDPLGWNGKVNFRSMMTLKVINFVSLNKKSNKFQTLAISSQKRGKILGIEKC